MSKFNQILSFKFFCYFEYCYSMETVDQVQPCTHRSNAKNVIFGFRRPQNVQIYQNLHFGNLTSKQHFLYYIRVKEIKKCSLKNLLEIVITNFSGINNYVKNFSSMFNDIIYLITTTHIGLRLS